MKTGVVVNNYDPTFKNRCQIRVYGLHTETIGGKYLILDDDLPWALPAPNPSAGNGGNSVPAIGEQVYVDVVDAYNIMYYGRVSPKGSVQDVLYENADDCDRVKVIAFSDDYDEDGTKNYLRLYYIPEKGLTIECNGNLISMPKYDTMEIKTKGGAGISIDTDSNDITIHTTSKVTLDCDEVRLTNKAEEKLILGSKLMETFNNHTHMTGDGTKSTTPIQQIVPGDFSDKIYIG